MNQQQAEGKSKADIKAERRAKQVFFALIVLIGLAGTIRCWNFSYDYHELLLVLNSTSSASFFYDFINFSKKYFLKEAQRAAKASKIGAKASDSPANAQKLQQQSKQLETKTKPKNDEKSAKAQKSVWFFCLKKFYFYFYFLIFSATGTWWNIG